MHIATATFCYHRAHPRVTNYICSFTIINYGPFAVTDYICDTQSDRDVVRIHGFMVMDMRTGVWNDFHEMLLSTTQDTNKWATNWWLQSKGFRDVLLEWQHWRWFGFSCSHAVTLSPTVSWHWKKITNWSFQSVDFWARRTSKWNATLREASRLETKQRSIPGTVFRNCSYRSTGPTPTLHVLEMCCALRL